MDVSLLDSTVPLYGTDEDLFSTSSTEAADLQLDFLNMLTTQLQYQDPLEPMENTEFTAQLATFTGLGEQQTTNELLTELLSTLGVDQLNQAVSYIGRDVVVEGNVMTVEDGHGEVAFELSEAGSVTVGIYDSYGNLAMELAPEEYGVGEWTLAIDDPLLSDGSYTFAAWMENGDTSKITTLQSGRVTGVINDDSGPVLDIDGYAVAFEDIRRVEEADG
ncbi:MAG: hypothetical protein HQL52_09060 [Magnetococcales bacterium]|nr:hypothetical protein [Magnetococcales bacterium]